MKFVPIIAGKAARVSDRLDICPNGHVMMIGESQVSVSSKSPQKAGFQELFAPLSKC